MRENAYHFTTPEIITRSALLLHPFFIPHIKCSIGKALGLGRAAGLVYILQSLIQTRYVKLFQVYDNASDTLLISTIRFLEASQISYRLPNGHFQSHYIVQSILLFSNNPTIAETSHLWSKSSQEFEVPIVQHEFLDPAELEAITRNRVNILRGLGPRLILPSR